MKKGDTFIPTHPYHVFIRLSDGELFTDGDHESNMKRAITEFTAQPNFCADYPRIYKAVYLVDIRTMEVLRAAEFGDGG